ncbi:MAG: 1-acyl-sn-glycerol-3-phosphate acyltransferase [Spirochaetales bacterium]|nr:1-acyl-sn-glycerol-3-phosphate acyltransferase [Spirochaetales bacterium]
MHWLNRSVYTFIKKTIKIYLSTFLEFKVWGKENIPPGPKIFCSNHFSSTDPFYMITIMDDPIHMIIGPGFSLPFFKYMLRLGKQINAMPEKRTTVIPTAINYLKNNESIYIFPEGVLNDQTQLNSFFSGLARIYLSNPVPIIPIGIISPRRYVKEKSRNIKIGEIEHKTLTVLTGKFYANIGEPLRFPEIEKNGLTKENINQVTNQIKSNIEFLIMDIKNNKFWS